MSMKRDESDFNVQRSVPNKSGKYASLDRGSVVLEENQVSPMVMKKKANVHLQPMSHKKAPMVQNSLGGQGLRAHQTDLNMGHSESNPLLNPLVINDRVKLEKLNHIPSVKSNLMQSETMSQGTLEKSNIMGSGLNYEGLPMGKKSVLAPINVLNTQLADSAPPFSKIENSSQMMNRKNNRTLKPLKR